MNRQAVAEYLKNGALITLLRNHDLAPAVWIYARENGEIRHTFSMPDNGVGGRSIPRSLTEEGKIFSGRLEEVIEFLRSFGLSDQEISEVIIEVGVAP